MSYREGEERVLDLLQSMKAWNTKNTSRGKYGILNTGKSDHYAILRPGAFSRVWMTPTTVHNNWTTVIEIWQRFKDETSTLSDITDRVNEILEEMDKWKNLNDPGTTVLDGTISSSGDVVEMWTRRGGPQYLKWEVTLEWKEESTVTYSE